MLEDVSIFLFGFARRAVLTTVMAPKGLAPICCAAQNHFLAPSMYRKETPDSAYALLLASAAGYVEWYTCYHYHYIQTWFLRYDVCITPVLIYLGTPGLTGTLHQLQ